MTSEVAQTRPAAAAAAPARGLRIRPSMAVPMADMWATDEILWGIQRLPEFSEIDNPRAHAGLVQHAFPFGRDELAVCGFTPRPRHHWRLSPLAVPSSQYNPTCRRCSSLVRPAALTPSASTELHSALSSPSGWQDRSIPTVREAPVRSLASAPDDRTWHEFAGSSPRTRPAAIDPVPTPDAGSLSSTKPPRRSRRRRRSSGTVVVQPGESQAVVPIIGLRPGMGVSASLRDLRMGAQVAALRADPKHATLTIRLDRIVDDPTAVRWSLAPIRATTPRPAGHTSRREPRAENG